MVQHKLTFNQILAGVEKNNSEQLMKKARLANGLAKESRGAQKQAAYAVKSGALGALVRKMPARVDVRKDIILTDFVIVELKNTNAGAAFSDLRSLITFCYQELKTMKKRIITIDIETLPTAEPFESKLFWETEEQYRKTSCDANLGRILCIGYCEQNESGTIVCQGGFGWRAETKDFEPDEQMILAEFWQFLRGFDTNRDLIIGHNIMDFDLPFIVQRSIIKGVHPTVNFYFGKYRSAPVFDTMRVWDCWKWGGSTSLKKLAYALGLECPKVDDIDGSKIYDAFCEGRYEEIYRYCMRDVKTTRNAWSKMNFRFPSEMPKPIALAF